jgi:hypothetical protein
MNNYEIKYRRGQWHIVILPVDLAVVRTFAEAERMVEGLKLCDRRDYDLKNNKT